MKRIQGELVLIPETKWTRAITFRADKIGLYLLFWQDDTLAAGIVFQYPTTNPNLTVGYSGWSYSTEQVELGRRNFYAL